MNEKIYHIHLISDSTGETVQTVARACDVQFEDAEALEHTWSMVRSDRQVEEVIAGIEKNPGFVLSTLLDKNHQRRLEEACLGLNIPCVSVIDPIIERMGYFLDSQIRGKPGQQHVLDEAYFTRIEAMDFAYRHDDGQASEELGEADVILFGVSRTSKTPTCIYLANRSIKAANYPLVPGMDIPDEILSLDKPLFVGLTQDPRNLVQIRQTRLELLKHHDPSSYIDFDAVNAEVTMARRLFTKKRWPVIDVTRRSIEETAAEIMRLLEARRTARES